MIANPSEKVCPLLIMARLVANIRCVEDGCAWWLARARRCGAILHDDEIALAPPAAACCKSPEELATRVEQLLALRHQHD